MHYYMSSYIYIIYKILLIICSEMILSVQFHKFDFILENPYKSIL